MERAGLRPRWGRAGAVLAALGLLLVCARYHGTTRSGLATLGSAAGTWLAPRSNTDGVEPVRVTDARPPVLAKGVASPIRVVQGTSPAEILAELKRLSGGTRQSNHPKKVCIIGSGNWGTTIAKVIGENVQNLDGFDNEVRMWVYEEQVQYQRRTENLSSLINTVHENVKYLPGIKLPENVVAEPDVAAAAEGADVLVWVLPHQFVPRLAGQVRDVVGKGAVSVSLIKGGMDVKGKDMELCSQLIAKEMKHDCLVLMGANLANEVATGDFSESTLGSRDRGVGEALVPLFNQPNFRVRMVQAVEGVELCGALKNVVALGAGFVDGLGLGGNTKAAVMRIGLQEMERFIQHFYPSDSVPLLESCGVADVITTSVGGRNRRCAEAFVRADGKKTWEQIEAEILPPGQKLQGTLTSAELQPIIEANGLQSELPLLCAIHAICFEGKPAASLFEALA